MNKKTIFTTAALLAIVAGSIGALAAAETPTRAALGDDSKPACMREMRNHKKLSEMTDAEKQAMEVKRKAMESEMQAVKDAARKGDYQAWYKLVITSGKQTEILKIINVDNFSDFSKLQQLRDQEDALIKSLGLDKVRGEGRGHGKFGFNDKSKRHGFEHDDQEDTGAAEADDSMDK
ncbi:MAG: hypothetical protein NTZ80_00700 [Patescibacteria group bacterium]|nr:hypothetical protein [Patescibacteria group bacterium]